jgi:two-component system phosphate regulon sensor histidine kinase PhoR
VEWGTDYKIMSSSSTKPFPWHYYVRTVRSRIFYVIVTAALTYVISQYFNEDIFLRIVFLVIAIISVAFIHGFFRIMPFRKVLEKIEQIQVQLPHDKKLSIIYEKDEWNLLEEMLGLAEHYMLQQKKWLDDQYQESETIVQTIPDAIVVVDKYENLKQYNAHFKEKFIQNKDIQGLKSEKIFKVFENELLTAFQDAVKNNQSIRMEAFYIEDINEYYNIAITPVHDTNNEVTGALGIFHNVTQSKLTEKMRVDFVANVSHEIRTPLTSIKGYAQLLQAHSDKIDEDLKPILEKIDLNSERLKELFDNLLKLSVIESRYELEKDPIDLRKLFQNISANLKAKHINRDISILYDFSIEEVKGDAKLMEQVFTNLMDNAIKYSKDSESVRIEVKSIENGERHEIKVCDNGPGIGEAELGRIFERFYRVQGQTNKAIEGSGLGLSIVKHIINKHKGSIEVDSKLGEGTCFTISLPN